MPKNTTQWPGQVSKLIHPPSPPLPQTQISTHLPFLKPPCLLLDPEVKHVNSYTPYKPNNYACIAAWKLHISTHQTFARIYLQIFFRPYFHYCLLSSVHYCRDLSHIHFFIHCSHMIFICSQSFIHHSTGIFGIKIMISFQLAC